MKILRVGAAAVLGLVVAAGAAAAQGRGMGTVPGVRLTPQQRQRIAAMRQQTRYQVRSHRSRRDLSPQERERRIAQARRMGHQRVMSQLTPEQRARFHSRWQQRHGVAGYRGMPGRGPGARPMQGRGPAPGQGPARSRGRGAMRGRGPFGR